MDFVSFSYYMTSCMAAQTDGLEMSPGNTVNGVKNPYLTASEWGWQTDPIGLRISLVELYDRFRKPLFIVENGLGARDTLTEDGKVHDPERIDFTHRYLLALRQGIEAGADVQGYFHWSLLDNFEWSEGYNERFGLVYVDYPTGTRTPKDSAAWYRETIDANGGNL